MILAAVNAVLALVVGFGANLSGERQALISAAVSAVLALIARQAVVPNATVDEHLDTAQRLFHLGGQLPPDDDVKTTGAP
jgi:RNase H-fold protein (predicted Holliday junction resolvase)